MYSYTLWKHWLAAVILSIPILGMIGVAGYLTWQHWEAAAVFTGILTTTVVVSWAIGYLINYGFPWSRI